MCSALADTCAVEDIIERAHLSELPEGVNDFYLTDEQLKTRTCARRKKSETLRKALMGRGIWAAARRARARAAAAARISERIEPR